MFLSAAGPPGAMVRLNRQVGRLKVFETPSCVKTLGGNVRGVYGCGGGFVVRLVGPGCSIGVYGVLFAWVMFWGV